MSNDVFMDTGYALALASISDQYHAVASNLADDLKAAGTHIVTTEAIVLEVGNGLAKARHRAAAVQLLDALYNDANIDIVPLTAELFINARNLFRSRMENGASPIASLLRS